MRTHEKIAPHPARGYLRQTAAAEYCGVSADTIQRASRLHASSGGRYGLRSRPAGRLVLYSIADLTAWIEAGMPTGIHAEVAS
jgi:hypothetical protein